MSKEKILIFRYARRDPKTGKIYRSRRPMPMWVDAEYKIKGRDSSL